MLMLLSSYIHLGKVYYQKDDLENARDCNKGDLEKAKVYYERALEVRKEQLGANHVDVASCYDKLARLYDDIGELEHSGVFVVAAIYV